MFEKLGKFARDILDDVTTERKTKKLEELRRENEELETSFHETATNTFNELMAIQQLLTDLSSFFPMEVIQHGLRSIRYGEIASMIDTFTQRLQEEEKKISEKRENLEEEFQTIFTQHLDRPFLDPEELKKMKIYAEKLQSIISRYQQLFQEVSAFRLECMRVDTQIRATMNESQTPREHALNTDDMLLPKPANDGQNPFRK